MFVSMRWLERHVNLDGITPEQLCDDLTLSTAEVEGLERFAPQLHDVVVGRVSTREPHPDAEKLSLSDGDPVRITTRRGSIDLPAQIDKHLREGHVWMPNGFGAAYPGENGELVVQGANLNQITDATDRDPFTGCPHHRYVPCRLERVEA